MWGRVRLVLSAEFDRPAWLQAAENALESDWTLALGLLQACLEESRVEDGVRMADRALARRTWDDSPRAFRRHLLERADRRDDMLRLLDLVARLGDEDLLAAAEIQRQHLQDTGDRDAMTAVCRKWSTPAADALYADWVNRAVADHGRSQENWIPFLLDEGDSLVGAAAWITAQRPQPPGRTSMPACTHLSRARVTMRPAAPGCSAPAPATCDGSCWSGGAETSTASCPIRPPPTAPATNARRSG